MKKRFDRSGTARRKAAAAVAALTMALVLAVGGAGAATLLSAQPETLTVGAVVPHITAGTPQASSPAAADREVCTAPEAESIVTAAPESAAESAAQPQQAEPAPAQTEKPETAEIAPAEPEEAVETPEAPAQPAEDTALEEENAPAMLLEETPELAAQDPQAPAADGTAQNDTASQHTPEGSVLLTPEQIQQALDSGALEDAEAQCIDLTDENGFFRWLFNWLFGTKDKEEEPAYSGWRTSGGKTYYYSQSTNKPVTGIQCIDNKLYYFNADGVLVIGNPASEIIDRLVEAGVMPVLISTDRQDIPLNSVCFDDFAGGVMAARHLVECGFRRIGFLCGSDKARSFLRRRSGVMVQTIDSLGFENFESRTPKTSDDSEVAVCFREWLESGHCPEAIITSHASAAAVVCRELKSCGLSCPEDYSIITFDDTIDNVFGLEITHLHIYPRELGIKSAQRIYQMMSSSGKDDRPYKIVLPLELTMGNSVKCRAK